MIQIARFTVVLCLAAGPLLSALPAKPRAIGRVSLIRGTLELNRARSQDWGFADTVTILYDSDRLRTPKNSAALVSLPGGLKLYLGEESHVRVESCPPDGRKINLNTITLYYGSGYLKAAEETDSLFQQNLITPSVSLYAAGGSGFGVTADRSTGTTELLALNGSLTVKSLFSGKTAILSPGKILSIDSDRDFFPAQPADSIEISRLGWVNALTPGLIKKEQSKAGAKREQARAILSGGAEDRIVITRFTNHSDYTGLWDIEKGLSAMLEGQLKKNAGLPVDRTESLPLEKTLDSLKNKATIAVLGEITRFEFRKDTRLGMTKNDAQTFLVCRIEITFTLIQPLDKRTLTQFKSVETIKEKETPGNTYKAVAERPFSLNDKVFFESIMGRTVQSVLSLTLIQMKEYLRI